MASFTEELDKELPVEDDSDAIRMSVYAAAKRAGVSLSAEKYLLASAYLLKLSA